MHYIGYIYKITINNPESSIHQCFYIGKHHKNAQKKNYYGSGLIIKNYKKKYGTIGLIKEILCNCTTEEELNIKEKEYISQYISTDLCLNITYGGDGGDTFTNHPNKETIREKHSNAVLGSKNPMFGKNFQCHGLKKRAISQRGKTIEEFFGEDKAALIHQHMSEGHLNHKHSEETKLKMKLHNNAIGKHWWTNGVQNIFSKTCPDGFYKGFHPKRKKKN